MAKKRATLPRIRVQNESSPSKQQYILQNNWQEFPIKRICLCSFHPFTSLIFSIFSISCVITILHSQQRPRGLPFIFACLAGGQFQLQTLGQSPVFSPSPPRLHPCLYHPVQESHTRFNWNTGSGSRRIVFCPFVEGNKKKLQKIVQVKPFFSLNNKIITVGIICLKRINRQETWLPLCLSVHQDSAFMCPTCPQWKSRVTGNWKWVHSYRFSGAKHMIYHRIRKCACRGSACQSIEIFLYCLEFTTSHIIVNYSKRCNFMDRIT